MSYKKGDEIILKIEEDFGYTEKTFRRASVTVIAHVPDTDGCICYVPCYESVPESFKLNERHLRWYGIDRKYLGEQGHIIDSETPIFRRIPAPQSESCDRCREPVLGAVRVDGAYTCRACRENPWR